MPRFRTLSSIAFVGGLALTAACSRGPDPTFSADVAPIVYAKCAGCHNPQGPGPFPLLSYDDLKAHADRIHEVVETGYMPPWPPDDDGPAFANDRSLSVDEKRTILRWIDDGMPPGDLAAAPAPPKTAEGWPLGPPDLVVQAPRAFHLEPVGHDVFRNLVIPAPVSGTRWVRAIDLRPGDARVVHHAILYVDRSGAARRLDAQDTAPGFGGMDVNVADAPDGHFLGWTPGTRPFRGYPDMAWRLDGSTDLVLQLHLMPAKEPTDVRPTVGLYFADSPPRRQPVLITLRNLHIDIPPGESNYEVEDRFKLPVDARVISVFPHAHHLGKDLRGWAELPDGKRRELIHIADWSFMRQGQYYYAEPITLPAGTTLVMHYTYDNSSDNPENPNDPPIRVRSGNRSTDEMGELIVQLVPRSADDAWRLMQARAQHDLGLDAGDWRARYNLALAAQEAGRLEAAESGYLDVLGKNPQVTPAWYNLGNVQLARENFGAAAEAFRRALAIDPSMARAEHNLGYALERLGRTDEALAHYRRSVEIDPHFAQGWHSLGNALFARNDLPGAAAAYREAIDAAPDLAGAHTNLGNVLRKEGRPVDALAEYERALQLAPGDPYASYNRALTLVDLGRVDEAVRALETLTSARPNVFDAWVTLGDLYRARGESGRAAAAYRHALTLVPGDGRVQAKLGSLAGER